MSYQTKIVIVGLFPGSDMAVRTQAEELSFILKKEFEQILTVSKYRSKVIRLFHIPLFLLFNARRYDLAVIQFYSGNSFIWQYIATHLVLLLNKKVIFTIHGGGVPNRIKKHPKRYLGLLRKAHLITCPSLFMISELKKHDIESVLIENTIATQEYEYVEKSVFNPEILWMRSFNELYNPQMAIRLIGEMKKSYPNIKLYMCGADMGALESTKRFAEECNLLDNVIFPGFLNKEKKAELAHRCSFYICTNKIDNAPVSFIEMWAYGIPIISTNAGGIPFLVKDGIDAILVDDNDHKAMASAINTIIKNPAIGQKMTAAGRQNVQNYSVENVTKKWLKSIYTTMKYE